LQDKILLLENDENSASLVVNSLKDSGFMVMKSTYKTLLKDALLINPHLFLISPEYNSVEEITSLCISIKTNSTSTHIPIIFISAQIDLEKFSKQCDVTAYVAKPLDTVDLNNTIKDILSI
jgi:DNA-binding response OmpR family regulator